MKKLLVQPLVLERLQQAYPKPKNSAQKALTKYVNLLEELVNASVMHGRGPWLREKDYYSVSMRSLTDYGGVIGSDKRGDKIRLNKWLKDNDLMLFDIIEEGSNFNEQLTIIQPSSLLQIQTVVPSLLPLGDLLGSEEIAEDERKFIQYFPDIKGMSSEQYSNTFDTLKVDVDALAHFYNDITCNPWKFTAHKIESLKYSAEFVLRISRHNNGMFPQRRKTSPFGRCYYEHVSVQNVPKILRNVMLGDCWEYDLSSSVFSWKMGYADACHEKHGQGQSFEDFCLATLYYLEWKEEMFADLRSELFGAQHELGVNEQNAMLKQVFTAISFGAKASCKGWKTTHRGWTPSTIANIFGDDAVMKRFLNSRTVQKFVDEQKQLDNFIHAGLKSGNDPVLKEKFVKTPKGTKSRAKVMAYMYQHGETLLMNAAHDFLSEHGYEVLARVHDAIFVRQQIAQEHLEAMHTQLHKVIFSNFARFGEKQIAAYSAT